MKLGTLVLATYASSAPLTRGVSNDAALIESLESDGVESFTNSFGLERATDFRPPAPISEINRDHSLTSGIDWIEFALSATAHHTQLEDWEAQAAEEAFLELFE
jgi:hypothetical protein